MQGTGFPTIGGKEGDWEEIPLYVPPPNIETGFCSFLKNVFFRTSNISQKTPSVLESSKNIILPPHTGLKTSNRPFSFFMPEN